MKIKLLITVSILASVLYISCTQKNKSSDNQTATPISKSLYDFKVNDINGKIFDLSELKGKKVMIVNVASKCGNTPQYADLEKLYQDYKEKNFVILGFPANNFLEQEPGTNEDIKKFCTLNYGVTFPMMSKISVKGSDMAPLYQWLTQKKENGKLDSEVEWNFQKYLIDENGQLVEVIHPKESVLSDKVYNWLNK
ncbi:glutathione peroxidase [Apibacter raozihei]|uniref:glutathione peroxidase n=1 Tax=Apibacter TaxID=1778601 RepID=UPI000FE41816|nr:MULTISPECIES: glutathione peroxidase [Apibacter]